MVDPVWLYFVQYTTYRIFHFRHLQLVLGALRLKTGWTPELLKNEKCEISKNMGPCSL